MKIQSRLLLMTISMVSVTVLIALLISTYLTRAALQTDAREMLSAVLKARHTALQQQLITIQRNVKTLATAPVTANSLAALSSAYGKLGANAQTLLQQNYLAKKSAHSTPTQSALSGSDYDRAHRTADSFFTQRRDIYEWYDIFLVDPQGNVVYTTAKEGDFATNLVTGPWKDTGLARAVTPLLHNAVPDVMSFADYSHYAPSNNEPASFLAIPVFDSEKQVFLGVFAIQLPIQEINALMKDTTGLGVSGETFVVGKEGWMLTDSRFRKEGTILGVQLKTAAVSKVMHGDSGLEQLIDYRGIDVYVAFQPLQPFHDVAMLGDHPQWGVIAKIDQDEVLAEYYDLRLKLLVTWAVLALFAAALGWWGSRGITRPLTQIKNALAKLSKGEVADIPNLQRRDEIGEMAKAAEIFREVSQQIEHEHWVGENVLALTKEVSTETHIDKAADKVLHLLCEKLGVPVGAIYLLNNEGSYQRVGAHGLARRSQTEDVFRVGEGLLGQCAKDNQAVVLSPVPAGLSIISTGLAEFPPYELVLYPIAHKNEVLALLELAAAKSLTPVQHEFLKTATAALGLHLANLQASEHNLKLLIETRKQSLELTEQQESLRRSNEEMHALTEELRSQAEEMKAQNEELKASQEELRAQQEEMKHKNQILETQSAQLESVLAEVKGNADELQRSNQYKSEFLANMSHELRTPLNSVLILSKNLVENHENNLTPEQIESASVIAESGTQLLTLINDILDLSKIEAGKLELMKEYFRLDDMLAYLRRIFSPQAEKKQLDFNIQVAPDLSESIYSDRQRLTQVLTNLLSNAVKFTDAGQVSIHVIKNHDDLQFEVIDSGIGIPADKLDHIFGAFQQLDGSTSRKYGGSGLGLAISRHLTGLLGGKLSVSSELGKGSHFIVRLLNQFNQPELLTQPEVKSPALALPPARHSTPVAVINTGANILVVEDDVRLLSILGRMITALGFTPLCVESAEQALTTISKEKVTGVLLDLGLPKMSGMELLRRLKADLKLARIPVFIMSGASDSGEAKVLGALGFLKKPVTRDTISAAIKVMTGAGKTSEGKRVLLVDDSPVDSKAIAKLFKKDAVEIVPAQNGNDALKLLKSHRFEAVILDLKLPDMTGFEWLKQACTHLNPPPVVVYSARELSENEIFELKEVAESIISKSTSNERLREEVLLALRLDASSSKIQHLAEGISNGKKLLLVDDDARNLFALTKVLRAEGYTVEVAADGAKALEMLPQGAFDAVLTDIMMPEMDGYALIRKIRTLGYTDIPIIAITAKAMQGDDVLCMQAGATAYFSKPVDVAQLISKLRST